MSEVIGYHQQKLPSEIFSDTLKSDRDDRSTQHKSTNNINNNNNTKSPSKACVPCFLFARKKKKPHKSSKKDKSRYHHNHDDDNSNSNSNNNNSNNSSTTLPKIEVDQYYTCSSANTTQGQQQTPNGSTEFMHKLSPSRNKEVKQPQQAPMRRSRLTLNMKNYHLRQNNYPNIEYYNINISNNNNDSNVTTTTTATGEIVCASTPRAERTEAKTGLVVEKLWMEQAPPVVGGKAFDPLEEAKIFEANEGIFVIDPATGKRYRKGRFLGKGGFANCFEFTDTSTNAVYAGKIVNKSLFQRQKQKEKMMLEIKLHGKLSHENIVAFHDYFEDDDNLYLILELCSRKSLDELMKRRGTLTEPEVRYYMRQVVEGCRYIHSKHIIHRDLKLGNLLLNGSMQIKIGDFGLATQVSTIDLRKKSVCGTPNYVAPEVIRRSFYSYEVDVWSIGCIMYTLLCGVTPFETNNLRATYDRISTATYSLPSYLSPTARDLIVRLLDLDPNNRLSLDQVLYEEFFTTGFAPAYLSPSTCFRRPTFPKSNYLSRAASMNTTPKSKQQQITNKQQFRQQPNRMQDLRKVSTTNVIAKSSPVDLSCDVRQVLEEEPVKSPPILKENSLNRAKKITSAIDLYKILGRCMGSIQEDTAVALNIPDSSIAYITRWVDFSNKYGFAFQLSYDCTGLLFNDTTRMVLLEDSTTVKYVDWSNSSSTWKLSATEEMPEDCKWKLSVLMYVRRYMHKRLKPTRFDSSRSTASSCTADTSSPPASTTTTSDSSPSNPISPEESLISSASSTAGVDSRGFAASAESTATNGSGPIFTLGSYSSSPERRQNKSSLLRVPSKKKSFVRANRDKENVADVDADFVPKPARRSVSLRQQQPTVSNQTSKPAKQKRLKRRHQTKDGLPRDAQNGATRVNKGSTQDVSSRSGSTSSTLADSSGTVFTEEVKKSEAVFVTKWFREEDGIMMQLSDGTYQVNFSGDHSKLILSLFKGEYVVTHLPISINNKHETSEMIPVKIKSNRKGSAAKEVKSPEKGDQVRDKAIGVEAEHYWLFEICDKGCSPALAEKLKVVRRKLYKLVNFEGQSV